MRHRSLQKGIARDFSLSNRVPQVGQVTIAIAAPISADHGMRGSYLALAAFSDFLDSDFVSEDFVSEEPEDDDSLAAFLSAAACFL